MFDMNTANWNPKLEKNMPQHPQLYIKKIMPFYLNSLKHLQ